MVEDIEELRIEAHLYVLGYWEPLREIEVAPYEIWTAQSIAREISKLTILRIVAAVASSGAWVDRGSECVRIQPLDCTRLRDIRDVAVTAIGVDSRDHARELRAAALHNSLSVCRIRRAEN